MKFSLFGVKYGKNLVVHGHIDLKLNHKAVAKIGNNFYSSNGMSINPICRNITGSITLAPNSKLTIGDNVGISSTCIWVHQSIFIGNYVNIGADSILIDSDCHSLNYIYRQNIKVDIANKINKEIIIEDNVLIGARCIILKGVTIGARSIIGAGSVVTNSIPPDSIAAGNPARLIKSLK
ncbi:hypothetical protein FACS189440_11870 [Bacteroidia bacterium]|nr:hypothetical protein FACS189440_11870 [Bacteroidia bacterium]